MKVRAFNLIPGAGFRLEGDLFGRIVAKVDRDVNTEVVYGRDHNGRPFAFDFCDYVEIVGLDANLGTESEVSDLGTEDEPIFDVVDTSADRFEEVSDSHHDAVIMALSELGYGPDDEERNAAVEALHTALLLAPQDLVEAIRLPRA